MSQSASRSDITGETKASVEPSASASLILPNDALITYRWHGCCGGARTIVYQDGRVVRKPEPEGILEDQHSQLSDTQMERLKELMTQANLGNWFPQSSPGGLGFWYEIAARHQNDVYYIRIFEKVPKTLKPLLDFLEDLGKPSREDNVGQNHRTRSRRRTGK